MIVCLIAAVSDNLVLGKDGQMPWHLPADLKHFKNLTMGSVLIMGRKTFESIGKPLPGRMNIVVTHNKTFQAEGVVVMHTVEAALDHAKRQGVMQSFIIGGGQLYRYALDQGLIDLIYITRVHHRFDGDVYFPALDTTKWNCVANRFSSADQEHLYGYSFETWIPKPKANS